MVRLSIGLLLTAAVAALWINPSHAQQVPGTLAKPGMAEARVWVNNKTRDEAIPVVMVGGDPKAPVPVFVQGQVPVIAAKQSWDYRSVVVGANEDLARALGTHGAEGWEAVGMTSLPGATTVTVLLKRPR